MHPSRLEGTHCRITSSGAYDGLLCVVVSFAASKGKFRVRLLDADKQLLVAEQSLCRCFHVLASSPVGKLQHYFTVKSELVQGGCGRGVVVETSVRGGLPLWEEAPLIRTYVPEEQHAERWLAYMTLADARDNREDAVWSKALAAFDDLGLGSNVPEHVRDGAAGIAASTPATDVQRVTDVLMRFFSNQYSPSSAADSGHSFASSLYAFTSRVNDPSASTPYSALSLRL